jgi:hypothetical protein
MNDFNEQLFEMIGRQRQQKSKAAAIVTPCNMIVSDNPEWDKNKRMAASTHERRIPIPGSSSGEALYKCGVHDYETKSISEFNEHLNMTHNSKAASVSSINKVKVIHEFLTSNGRL